MFLIDLTFNFMCDNRRLQSALEITNENCTLKDSLCYSSIIAASGYNTDQTPRSRIRPK